MTSEQPKSTDRAMAWLVFVAFLALAAAVSAYVWRMSRMADRALFENAVQSTHDALAFRLETYVNVLRSASGLFAIDRNAEPADVRQFISHLNIQERYPGIQGIGLTLRVERSEVSSVESQMREEFSDFRIWPPGARPEYHAIILLEPLDRRNRAAIGYDMFTDPVRRVAMERARDTGRPAASGPVVLVQEIDERKQAGFLIYVPIYATHVVPSTVSERRETNLGFIYAPFRTDDLLGGVLGAQKRPEVVFEIYDGGQRLFSSGEPTVNPRFSAQRPVVVAGRQWTVRFTSRRPVGGAPLFLTTATAVSGLVISFLVFALLRVQIVARARAEAVAEQLRRSEAELQQANKAKDEFLATLSHELRTPMTAIIGWGKLMATVQLDPETTSMAVDAIQKSAKTQAQLIDDLLDVSRITAGKMRIDRQPIDLRLVVEAANDAIAPTAGAKGIHVETDISIEPVNVDGDAARLQQVVTNLLTNAVKFTPANGLVRMSVGVEDGEAVVEVCDNGQGIDPAFLPHMFERFRQADSSTTRSYTGLGLGLAIVSHLVELHGGRVTARSDGPGRGATFRVSLPLLHDMRQAVRSMAPDDSEIATAVRAAQLLVVDDEESVRNYVATVFSRSGAQLRAVASAEEALRSMAHWLPDAIVTDLGMPGIDGFELLRRIRSDRRLRDVPVVALTAYARAEDRERGLEAGFDAFVTKPVEPAVLLREVARVIRTSEKKSAGPEGPARA